jgi:hypothetical protein
VGPASAHTIYEYLAFLSLEGAVQPKSWPQYIAVISSMHGDLLLPNPWLDSGLCSTFVQSASKLASAAAEEHPSRKPLLAEHVLLFLRAALFSTDLKLLRAVVAVTLAFLTFVRGASVMGLVKEELQVSDKGFEVRVWDGYPCKGAGIARSIAISIADCPVVGQVCAAAGSSLWPHSSASGLRAAPRGALSLEGILNTCLQQCVAAVALDGVYGPALKGHSCRSGGVSALHAIGGSLPCAAAREGWASLATVF